MGQGGIDASDAGSARGRVRDEDQTVILPRVDAGKARADANQARPAAEKARVDADKARADAGQKRADAGRALEEGARAEDLAQEFLAQEMLAQDLMADVPWPDDNAAYAGERPAAELATSLASGLATFPYLGRTIRRRFRFWCIAGVVGLILGLGLHYAKPPPAKAVTSVRVADGPASNPLDEVTTQVAQVTSRVVASMAEKKLGLTENVNKFLASYTAVSVTDQIISITVSAPTGPEALSRATALANAYLQFQSDQLQIVQHGVVAQLNQQIKNLERQIGTDNPAQRSQDQGTLGQLQKALQDFDLSNQVGNAQINAGSRLLDKATLLPPSKFKSSAVYALGGLVAGLVVGICIVIIGALVSDKLRRRDDIARALSAPVELSVGRVRARRRTRRRDLAALRDRNLQRVVAYLDRLIPARASRRAPALVVIPLEAPQAGALAVAALAFARAQRDQKVVVADLLDGAPAARLLGVREPGTHTVDLAGQKLTVIVPDGLGPVGPLAKPGAQEPATQAGPQVDIAAAYSNADIMLTLAAADPALSADYLRTWGTGSIVLVTAGSSSASKLHATAEMIRLAGLRILSAVVLGTDKTDDSSGAWATAGPDADGEYQENGQMAPVDAFLSAVVQADRK